jgi:glycosyltransferase involved in cell wall biosynthesis
MLPTSSPMITVVIPYFQRSPGILAKALASIAAQEGCPLPIQVIVVDDASPAPVAAELAGVGAMPHPVRVITQANGGPGAARNTGLDHAPPGTRYLAFLDSDDEWMPDHLARAVAALECGYDFCKSAFKTFVTLLPRIFCIASVTATRCRGPCSAHISSLTRGVLGDSLPRH